MIITVTYKKKIMVILLLWFFFCLLHLIVVSRSPYKNPDKSFPDQQNGIKNILRVYFWTEEQHKNKTILTKAQKMAKQNTLGSSTIKKSFYLFSLVLAHRYDIIIH